MGLVEFIVFVIRDIQEAIWGFVQWARRQL
jgi:hypothetical protein